MASDYAAIRAENQRRYGTDIARIGPMLLADRYDGLSTFGQRASVVMRWIPGRILALWPNSVDIP